MNTYFSIDKKLYFKILENAKMHINTFFLGAPRNTFVIILDKDENLLN